MATANILSCSLGYLRRFTWVSAVPKQGRFWRPSIVSHLEVYHWQKRGLQTFFSEGHISYHTTVRGLHILRNVIVSWYVTFYQIFKKIRRCITWTNDANLVGQAFFWTVHVSNGVRQGGVLSPYLFVVYLDDLSNELNNIKAGCYIGEVLLNHLMFADDICVFCPSVRWLQRILDVCQTYAESHGIIFNCNKTVCMTFKAKSAKSTATPVLKLGGQYVNSVDQYKYLGIFIGDWTLRWQRHSETTPMSKLCSKQVASLFYPLFKCS